MITKELLIIRKEKLGKDGEQGTRSTVFAYDGPACSHTWVGGELRWTDLDRNGIRDTNVSCSPQGSFIGKHTLSPKRSTPVNKVYVYQLENVPGAVALQLHIGNFFGDVSKGWQSDVEGCILLGKEKGLIKNKKGVLQEGISGSVDAIKEFMNWANEEDIMVRITEQFPGGLDESTIVN
jgi:hypothetical protein